MFAVYDNGNMIFRNSADNLTQYNAITAPGKIPLNPDEENTFQKFWEKKKKSENEAINTYKEIANLDTSEPIYHVKDIMTKAPKTLLTSSTLQDAYSLLKEEKVGHIPVLTSNDKIVGLINNTLILDLLINTNMTPDSILNRQVDSLSFDEFITTDPLSDIRRVAQVMIKFRINALPVVDEEGVLKGIVSKTDIIDAVSHIPHLQLWS